MDEVGGKIGHWASSSWATLLHSVGWSALELADLLKWPCDSGRTQILPGAINLQEVGYPILAKCYGVFLQEDTDIAAMMGAVGGKLEQHLRAEGTGLIDEHPNLAAYVGRGEGRPAYQRAFADQLAVFTQ